MLAERAVNAPVLAVVLPIGPGAANVALPSVAALMAPLQVNPVLVVHVSAPLEPLQFGTASAVGLALEPVPLPTTVFAGWVARSVVVTRPVAVRLPVTVGAESVDPEIVGEVARTGDPEPVTAFARPAATPVPRPLTPVEMGSPVPFVSVTAEGVPRFGVVRAGDVDSTAAPVPVDDVDPVPPCEIDSGVERPDSDVISLFDPLDAAPRFVLAPDAVVAPVPP